MKKITIRTVCVAIFLFFVIAIITVNGQKVYIGAQDYGTPGMISTDVYEIGYLIYHFNGSTPDQVWDTQAETYLPASGGFPFPTGLIYFGPINNFNPSDAGAHYKVLILIKRRSGNDIICGGQKLSGFMTPIDLLGTPFTVSPVILTNP